MLRQTVVGLRGSIVPIGILVFLGLLFLSIYELLASAAAAVVLGILYLLALLWVVKYKLMTVEYAVVGTSFLLRRLVCGRILSTETIPFASVTAIGYGERLRRRDPTIPCRDYCATFRGKYRSHLLIFYKAEDGTPRKLKCEPNETIRAALRTHTEGKFYER